MVNFQNIPQKVKALNEYKNTVRNAKTIKNNLVKLAKDNFITAKRIALQKYTRELKK